MPGSGRILRVLLWVSVIMASAWIGGSLFNMLVIVPLWSASPPESVRGFFAGTDFNRTIRNFFGPPWMVARNAPVLAALLVGCLRCAGILPDSDHGLPGVRPRPDPRLYLSHQCRALRAGRRGSSSGGGESDGGSVDPGGSDPLRGRVRRLPGASARVPSSDSLKSAREAGGAARDEGSLIGSRPGASEERRRERLGPRISSGSR